MTNNRRIVFKEVILNWWYFVIVLDFHEIPLDKAVFSNDLIHRNATWRSEYLGRRCIEWKSYDGRQTFENDFDFQSEKTNYILFDGSYANVVADKRVIVLYLSPAHNTCLCLVFCRTIRFFFYFRKATVKRNHYGNKAHRTANKTRILNEGGGRLQDGIDYSFRRAFDAPVPPPPPTVRRAHIPPRSTAIRLFTPPPPIPEIVYRHRHIYSLVYTTSRHGLSYQTPGDQNKSIRIRHSRRMICFEREYIFIFFIKRVFNVLIFKNKFYFGNIRHRT